MHAIAGLSWIVVDEADDAHVLRVARQQLAQRRAGRVARAVDHDPAPGLRCRWTNSPTSRNEARDSVTAISQQHAVDGEHRARVAEEAEDEENHDAATRSDAEEHASGHDQRVGHAEMAPDAPVDADDEERHHLRRENTGSELENIWKFFMKSSGSSNRIRYAA